MSNFVDIIGEHAKKIGWEAINQLDETTIVLPFDMGDNRSQNVIISHYPQEESSDFVEITSAVIKMDGFPDGKLGKEMAEKLLRENCSMALVNWAIDETSEGAYLVARSGWMLDDLDAEELEMAVGIVSNVADNMESSLGVDNF